MFACDDFEGFIPRWLLASLLLGFLCFVGGLAARSAKTKRTLIGGVTSAGAVALAFAIGSLIYPWIEAYWMSARDLIATVPIAFLFGAVGGWLSAEKA